MSKPTFVFAIWFALSAAAHILLGYTVPREEAAIVVSLYLFLSGLFVCALLSQRLALKSLVAAGIVFRVLFLFALPELSDDYLRYLWDGELITRGISPFAHRPSEIPPNVRPDFGAEAEALFAFKDNYSSYPPFSQFLFALSRWLSPDSITGSVIALRLITLMMEIGTVMFILSLLRHWGQDQRLALLYVLNPLVIIELSGNLHSEAGMVFCLVGAMWLLAREKLIWSSVAFGLAISAKLIPLIFLPLLLRRLGWSKSLMYSAVAAGVTLIGFLPFEFSDFDNIKDSLSLYYNNFEFNASLFALTKWIGGFSSAHDIGFVFAGLTLWAVLIVVATDKGKDVQSLFTAFLLCLTSYHLLATTVNPWYIAPLVLFSVFSRHRYALVWAALIPISYSAFAHADYHQTTGLVLLQYLPMYGLFAFDLFRGTSLGRMLHRRQCLWRARMKLRRLPVSFKAGESVLDIGTGNGAVAHLLNLRDIQLLAVDVRNKSAFEDIRPELYDGRRLPFASDQFDTTLLLTVLHHVSDPVQVLKEAVRTTRSRLIIIEDVYAHRLQRALTLSADSIVNWEFASHPHSNRTEEAWERLFGEQGLKVTYKRVHRPLGIFRQAVYVLHK